MGHADAYFHSADSARQTLHRRITPTDSQYDTQVSRWNTLAEFLKPELRARSGYPTRSWLQGSYKFDTQIRPVRKGEEFDIDLGIYFCWDGKPEDGDHGPKDLKDMTQAALEIFAVENDDVVEVAQPPKMRCARIHFKDDFHIDVPTYHLDQSADERSLTTEDDTWEDSDPKALYQWFKDEFNEDERRTVKRIVRYFKAWATLKFKAINERPSSVLLTVLASNALRELGAFEVDEDDLFGAAIRHVLAEIESGQDVRNPVDQSENLASRLTQAQWGEFQNKLRNLKTVSDKALASSDELTACTAWSAAFEHLFPLPETEKLEKALSENALAVTQMPDISVTAVSKDNSSVRRSGVNKIGPIPKNCRIYFAVTNGATFPIGTRFLWMVRNEGSEAENTNDLGHASGDGTHVEESSAYYGTHYMDCTAVSGSRLLGVRRVRVVVSPQPAPPRHPPKPDYVRLR